MAVTSTPISSELVLVMDYGTNSTGKQQSKERSFKSLDPDSSGDNVYAAAQIILALHEKNHLSIQRRDLVELSEQ